MKFLKYWPFAILAGLFVYSCYLLGPLVSGLLLFVTACVVLANMFAPFRFVGRMLGFAGRFF